METTTLSTLAALLKQPSVEPNYPESLTTPESEQDRDGSVNLVTIFDLGCNDRYRVLKLIEELLDTQEEVDQLKQKLDEEKLEFREKKSTLLKKLDSLNEKYERALKEIKILKDKHSHTLRKLEHKISTVSNKFEASVTEILELRKANAELRQENMALRKLNCESTTSATVVQEENSRLNLQLEISRHNEQALRKQLKKYVSETNAYQENLRSYNESQSQSSSALQDKTRHDQSQSHEYREVERNLGSGDRCDLFVKQTSSNSGMNTIKAPTKADLQQSNPSTFAFSNNNNYIKPDCIAPFPQTHPDFPGSNISLEDRNILENLFFRF